MRWLYFLVACGGPEEVPRGVVNNTDEPGVSGSPARGSPGSTGAYEAYWVQLERVPSPASNMSLSPVRFIDGARATQFVEPCVEGRREASVCRGYMANVGTTLETYGVYDCANPERCVADTVTAWGESLVTAGWRHTNDKWTAEDWEVTLATRTREDEWYACAAIRGPCP